MRMAIDVSSEFQDEQQQQQQPLEPVSSHGKRTVRGVVIPPLNLQSPTRQDDESQEQHHRPAHPGRRRTALLHSGPQPSTPSENAISGSATATQVSGGNPGVGAGRQRHSHGVHGVGRGDGRRGSSVAEGVDVAIVATLPVTATGNSYLPDGMEGSMTEEERASREAIAAELGTSYATRVYKEHLRSHNFRQPGVLERIPTPTEEQTRQHQQMNQVRSTAADVSRVPHLSLPAQPQPRPHSHGHAHTHTYSNPHERHISARYSNGDARSSTSTSTGALPGAPATPASPGEGSGRQSSSSAIADLEGALPLHLLPQAPQHHSQPGYSSSGQQPQDTPRSFLAQPSSRSATSDGRLGTAASSIGMADVEVEAETPPPPPPPPAAARGADGIETLDEVMAPALRERIRQLLSAQDALRAHQARMRAYEEEREKVVRARQAAASQMAVHVGASGTRRGGLRCRHVSNRNTARITRHGGGGNAGRRGHLTSRSTSPVMFRAAATVLPASPTVTAATFVLAGKAAALPQAAQVATTAEVPPLTARVTLPAMQLRMSSVAVAGRISPDVSSGPPTAAAMGPGTVASGRIGRSMSLATSRSLKRVQLVTTKNDKTAKGTGKGKDKKKEGKRGARRGKDSSSSVSRSGSSDSSSSGSSSASSSSSDGSSSDGEGRSTGATSPSQRALPSRTTSSSVAVPSGPFGTATAAATAAAGASVPAAAATPAANGNAKADAAMAGAAQAPPRQHDSSTSEASLTPQASSASVQTGSGTSGTRSYGGGSTRPGRSSMRASVPPPQRIVLPGPQGDLNHLMLLLEKLPRKTPRAKPPLPQVPASGLISPPRASSAGALAIPDIPKSLSPDHRQRLSQQIQHLHHLSRSTSPNGRFSYDIGEPSVWGEAIAQAALNGFPSGAAATTLARCEEKLPSCHKGSLSPVASTLLLATAEPSGLVIQSSAEHQQAIWDTGANLQEAAAAVREGTAVEGNTGPRLGSDDGEGEGDDIPLAVKVMMGCVPEYDMLLATWPASLPSQVPRKFSPGPVDQQGSAISIVQHPHGNIHRHHHHHHHHHEHHHDDHHHQHRSHRQENSLQDLHELHEFHGSQLRMHRNLGHVHKHHRNNSSQEDQNAEPDKRQSEDAGYGNSHGANPGRAGHDSPPRPSGRFMDRPYSINNGADDGDTGGGDTVVGSRGRSHGAGNSDAEDLEKFDPAWKALRERRRLPPEIMLPARLTCPATTAREGGGAHSFAPEQVAAMASGRAVGSLTGGISGGRLSGSGAGGPSSSSVLGAALSMPSLVRVAPIPPPALTAPALVRGGGGALLPGLGVRSGAPERERAQAMSGAVGGCSAVDACNSPIYELYALGLLPNPSLLRASMASTTTRPNAPMRRRQPGFTAPTTFSGCAAAAAASILDFGDQPPRFCSSSTRSTTAGAAASFSNLLPLRISRQELGPISAHGAALDVSSRAGGGAAGNGSGPFSAPSSPKPSIYVHTHPHVIPGSALQVAEAAEAEVMQARSKMGRSSALDLQHMLGVTVPAPMLQAR